MKFNITDVTPETVCIHGQTLAREYAEVVLLNLMVASKGDNHSGIITIAETFVAAGLSLEAHPKALRLHREHLHEIALEEARRQQEARAHEERCRVPTREELAEYHAEKKRRTQEILERGQRYRAARG